MRHHAALRTSRRGFLATGGVAVAAALLAACGDGGGSSGRVELWQSFTSTELQKFFKARFVDAYNDRHDHTVILTPKPVEALDRLLQTAVAAGRGPDIVVTPGPGQAVAYVDAGSVIPLDTYADRYGWADKLQGWALDTGRVNGKLYSLPSTYETLVNIYNPAVFAERGWQPPTTRQELEAICTEAADLGMMPLAAGNAEWKPATEWLVTIFLNQFAGAPAVHQALTGKARWTDAAFVDAIALLNDYFQRGWFGGGVQSYFTNSFGDLHAKLAGGQAAMALTGSWTANELPPYFGEEAGNDATWDWAALPTLGPGVPADQFILSVGGTYSINADSDSADAAASFLDFLVSDPKRQADALAEVGQPPAPVKLTDGDFPDGTDERFQRVYTTAAGASTFGYSTWTFWPPKANTYVYTEMEKVIVGQVTPEEYCAGLDRTFAEELDAGKVPPVPEPTARPGG